MDRCGLLLWELLNFAAANTRMQPLIPECNRQSFYRGYAAACASIGTILGICCDVALAAKGHVALFTDPAIISRWPAIWARASWPEGSFDCSKSYSGQSDWSMLNSRPALDHKVVWVSLNYTTVSSARACVLVGPNLLYSHLIGPCWAPPYDPWSEAVLSVVSV